MKYKACDGCEKGHKGMIEPTEDADPCDGCGMKKKRAEAKTDRAQVQRADLWGPAAWAPSVSKFKRTPEGFLTGRAIVTNIGVFQYKDADGTIHGELRLPEEVFAEASLESLKLKPVTNNHPTELVTVDNVKQLQVGSLGANPSSQTNDDGHVPMNDLTNGLHLAIDMVITDADTIADVQAGKRGLSCGYTCDIEQVSGVYLGMPYTAIQRNIRYNHVAIVDQGRAGDAAKIVMDSADSAGCAVYNHTAKEDSTMEFKKIVLDSVEYQAEAPVLTELSKRKGRIDELTAECDTLKVDRSTLEAERDALKEKLDAAQAALEEAKKLGPEKLDAAVKERLELLDTASKAKVKADGLTPAEVEKAVVAAVFPKTKLDGKDEAYIKTLYTAAKDELAAREDSNADAAQRLALTGHDLPAPESRSDGQPNSWLDGIRARKAQSK